MNRVQELERLAKKADKNLDKDLFNFYKGALKKLKKTVKDYTDVFETLDEYEKMLYMTAFKKSKVIEDIVNGVSDYTQNSIKVFLNDKAIDGYMGVLYDVEGKIKMGLEFNKINKKYIDTLVNKKTVGKDFSKRIYGRTDKMAKVVKDELLNGAISGKGYRDIAKNIAEQTEATYKQSLNIARTEGSRVQSETTQKGYEEAEDLGVDIKKQWLSSLDDTTRGEHADLDGQTVGIDEEFEIDGYSAIGPGLFGDSSMDINCRCTTITIVEGISPKLRKDNITKETVEFKSYAEWKQSKGG